MYICNKRNNNMLCILITIQKTWIENVNWNCKNRLIRKLQYEDERCYYLCKLWEHLYYRWWLFQCICNGTALNQSFCGHRPALEREGHTWVGVGYKHSYCCCDKFSVKRWIFCTDRAELANTIFIQGCDYHLSWGFDVNLCTQVGKVWRNVFDNKTCIYNVHTNYSDKDKKEFYIGIICWAYWTIANFIFECPITSNPSRQLNYMHLIWEISYIYVPKLLLKGT